MSRISPIIGNPGVLLGICLLLTACIIPVSSSPADLPPAETNSDLQKIIESGIKTADIPGVQIEVATPDWTWNAAAGDASALNKTPAVPGMYFLIASITKMFTSIAIQELAEEGKLSLNDTIDQWLPEDLVSRIPDGDRITIRELLYHTSGIADYDEEAIIMQELQDPDTPVSYDAAIEQGINASPLFPVGTNYSYSNVNYLLLTKIIDKAAGIPFEEYINQTIFQSAGLNQTSFHRRNLLPGSSMDPSEQEADGTVQRYGDVYVEFDRGAGDIISTTSDLNRFHRALREGRLISLTSLSDMENMTPQSMKTENNATSGYGLGYSVNHNADQNITVKGHSGGYPGSFSYLYYLPELDTYISMNLNTNRNYSEAFQDIFHRILDYLSEEYRR
ncbi:MAG: beta-lactamase family protein [Methanospirillum sp.]|nr:beta-lactamase family protein [Methanospirillum sp.]